MKKLATISLVAFVVVLALLGVLINYGAKWYLESENRNFRKIRAESVVDCETMHFHCAVTKDSIEMFDSFIAQRRDIESKNIVGESALFWTIRGTEATSVDSPGRRMDLVKRSKFIDKLLEAGANVEVKNVREMTLLHAALRSDLQTVRKIVSNGADVNQLSNDQYYYLDSKPKRRWVHPLYVAVRRGDEQAVKYLINAGASIDTLSMSVSDVLETALNLSVSNDNLSMTKLLLKYEANPNLEKTYDGKSLGSSLHTSVNNNNLEITKLLLEAGADPNAIDFYKRTPLSPTGYDRKPEITELLLSYGARDEQFKE